MAVSLGPDRTVTDPFGGLGDLLARRLRTPGPAEDSFADDPLRMLRAVRFVAQLGLAPDADSSGSIAASGRTPLPPIARKLATGPCSGATTLTRRVR